MPDYPVPQNDRRTTLTATGGETVLAADFPIYDATEIEVRRTRAGVTVVLVNAVDYAVSNLADDGFDVTPAGSYTPAVSGDVFTIDGKTRIERVTEFTQNSFKAPALNRELDRRTFIEQELKRDQAEALDAGDDAVEAGQAADRAARERKLAAAAASRGTGAAMRAENEAGEATAQRELAQMFAAFAGGVTAQVASLVRRLKSAAHVASVAQGAASHAAAAALWFRRAKQMADIATSERAAAAASRAGLLVHERRARTAATAAAASAASLTDDQIVLKAQVFG